MRKYLLFWLTLALFLSELALYLDVVYGYIIYCFLIVGALIFLSHDEYLDNYGKLASVIMIVPIVRMVEIFFDFNIFLRSMVVYSSILLMVCYHLFVFRINQKLY